MTVLALILILVIIPAGVGYFLYEGYLGEAGGSSGGRFLPLLLHHFGRDRMEPGDFLIYRKSKASPRPGPRARNVEASAHGDDYYYEVDKFWTLADVLQDGRLVAMTRTGKRVYLQQKDERLRKAGLLDRLRYRNRFPSV